MEEKRNDHHTATPEAPEQTVPAARRTEMPSEEDAEALISRISRRSFLWAAGAVAAAVGGWDFLVTRPESDGIAGPLRRVLGFNEKVALRTLYSDSHQSPAFPQRFVAEPIETGDVGLDDPSDVQDWTLTVIGGKRIAGKLDDSGAVALSLSDIKALPKYDVVAEHKCIEGWSRVVHWSGARFADFARAYGPASFPAYVSMKTPDEQYYVGIDREAVLHPQTLLCYEMNGAPLSLPHGAPLRLAIPNKYGIKNIKRIGTIEFTEKRPADYWAEQGYDWYAGL